MIRYAMIFAKTTNCACISLLVGLKSNPLVLTSEVCVLKMNGNEVGQELHTISGITHKNKLTFHN